MRIRNLYSHGTKFKTKDLSSVTSVDSGLELLKVKYGLDYKVLDSRLSFGSLFKALDYLLRFDVRFR